MYYHSHILTYGIKTLPQCYKLWTNKHWLTDVEREKIELSHLFEQIDEKAAEKRKGAAEAEAEKGEEEVKMDE